MDQRCHQVHHIVEPAWRRRLDPDVRMHRALADGTRSHLLRILSAAAHALDAHELAEQLDLHLTTGTRRPRRARRRGPGHIAHRGPHHAGRPGRLYEAVAGALAASDSTGYRLLAEMLASRLAGTSTDVTQDAITAGREWGTYLVERPPPFTTTPIGTARAEVIGLLDRLGFQPELSDDGTRIMLRRCPFLDVARRHPDVVCSLHLGLLQGALATLGAPLQARELEPFVQPSQCVAHITATTPEHPG